MCIQKSDTEHISENKLLYTRVASKPKQAQTKRVSLCDAINIFTSTHRTVLQHSVSDLSCVSRQNLHSVHTVG